MDNTAQSTVNNSQLTGGTSQAVEDQSVVQPVPIVTPQHASQSNQSETVVKPVPNRGGIPVVSVQAVTPIPQVIEPDLPAEEPTSQIDTARAEQVNPIAMPVNPQPAEVTPEVQVVTQTDANQSAIPQQGGSSKNREHEPAAPAFPDVVKMSEQQIQEEEEKVGDEIDTLIEGSPDTEQPKISHELKIAGVEHAIGDIAQSIPQAGGKTPYLPMTFTEAELTRKKYKWKDSIAWLSDLIVYHWKKISSKKRS